MTLGIWLRTHLLTGPPSTVKAIQLEASTAALTFSKHRSIFYLILAGTPLEGKQPLGL